MPTSRIPANVLTTGISKNYKCANLRSTRRCQIPVESPIATINWKGPFSEDDSPCMAIMVSFLPRAMVSLASPRSDKVSRRASPLGRGLPEGLEKPVMRIVSMMILFPSMGQKGMADIIFFLAIEPAKSRLEFMLNFSLPTWKSRTDKVFPGLMNWEIAELLTKEELLIICEMIPVLGGKNRREIKLFSRKCNTD